MLSQFIEVYRFYARNHRTVGCRVTHLVGVPILALSFFLLVRRPKTSIALGALGYGLQILGHYVFEKNTPVLIRTKDWRVIPAAFAFVGYEWWAVFTKRFPNENQDPFAALSTESETSTTRVPASNGRSKIY